MGSRLTARAVAAPAAIAVIAAMLCGCAPRAAYAQAVPGAHTAAAASGAVRAAAERAQKGFERRRRGMLPRSEGVGGRCDVRIGRYCYWYDEAGRKGPPEPPRIAAERRRLLATLDSAALAAPGDDFVAGQRVRYWLEAGAPDTALAAARECAGTGWWCEVLRGWALHEVGDAAGAGAAFDSALAAMPAPERCRWRDISLLLDDDARKRYSRLDCDARAPVERRFWWLSTPFYSRGGNDRRNEHFARHALAWLARTSATTYGSRWGDDLEELLLRYGWSARWSRREPPPSARPAPDEVIGHEPVPAYRWTAGPRLLADPYTAEPDDWVPRDPDPRERFAPPWARGLVELRASAAQFRRGDSLLVVASFASPADSLLPPARAALLLAREGEHPVSAAFRADSTGGVARIMVAAAPHLVSMELLGDSASAARARFAVEPPHIARGVLTLSGLLPYLPASAGDTTFAHAVELAVRGDELRVPAVVGIYWETYGLPPGRHTLETSLAVVDEDRPGWLSRLWQRARGSARAAPVNVRWTDLQLVRDDSPGSRAMMLELPELPEGSYMLRLTVRDPRSGGVVESRRRLRVVR